ncbi:hypothetical protein [Demequina sp.]|uniref:hypothetical protein n=1 Tax=Demequina sp. TaxID=2050685 RepID=UPI0025EF7264|nr:hypothetical protein [Demequina sp.]
MTDARDLTTVAWVESPLQLINAIEHAHRHHAATGARSVVLWREGVRQLADTATWLGPHAIPVADLVPAGGAWDPRFRAARTRVIGDAFSGQYRTVVAATGARETVVVDDGSAALHLAAALAGTEPFGRMGQVESAHQRALGVVTASRLRAAARGGRLTLFTAYADDSALADVPGARIVLNDYTWLRTVQAPAPSRLAPSVVLGSALAVDGYIDAAAYEGWAASLARGAVYLPHRRESDESLARLGQSGLRVLRPGLPAEIVLGLAADVREVHSLPSSTGATLSRVLREATLTVHAVPPGWWTPSADEAMRSTLDYLANTARDAGQKED